MCYNDIFLVFFFVCVCVCVVEDALELLIFGKGIFTESSNKHEQRDFYWVQLLFHTTYFI